MECIVVEDSYYIISQLVEQLGILLPVRKEEQFHYK
jgi:hypothetical protein